MVEGGLHIGAPSPEESRACSPRSGLLLADRPNPSIEWACPSGRGRLRPAAHLVRQASK